VVSVNFLRRATDCVTLDGDLAEGDLDRHAGLDAESRAVEGVGNARLHRNAAADRVLQEQHRACSPRARRRRRWIFTGIRFCPYTRSRKDYRYRAEATALSGATRT